MDAGRGGISSSELVLDDYYSAVSDQIVTISTLAHVHVVLLLVIVVMVLALHDACPCGSASCACARP
eukprot:6199376-Pleurochrysis_carterae.AAC.1